MYFKVNKKTFLENINIVFRAVSINSPMPALHNIKLSVQDDNIELMASDSDISIKTVIYVSDDSNLEVINTGSILLDGKYLADMIRKIDSEIVEVEIIDGCLTNIRGSAVNFKLNGIKAENFPMIDFSQPDESFTINSDVLKNVIAQTCFATSDKEIRPVLTGVNFSCQGNVLNCIASDSFRLANKKIYLDNEHNFNITIPAKSLSDIAKIINSDCDITIAINDRKALFVIDNVLVQTRLIDGMYPDILKLIPESFEYELTIDSRDLLNALDRASFIKNDGIYIVKMEMDNNEINISSKSNEIDSSEKIIPIDYVGDFLDISFKGNYVYDAIRALNAFQIKLLFNGKLKPFILKSTEDDDVIQLVVPIKTYN